MDQELLVLPDEVLRQQVCSECYLYLSVTPVAVNRKGEKVCGRCLPRVPLRDQDSLRSYQLAWNFGSFGTISAFNLLSENVLYKCVNHFEGCKDLLKTYETVTHEKYCFGKKRNCFFCSFTGNVCQIVNHCAKTHTENLTWDGILEFDPDSCESKQCVFVKNDSLYLITVRTSQENLNIVISSEVLQMNITKQYAIRFWLSSYPNMSEVEFVDYGLFNMENKTCFKKSFKELRYHFGNIEGNVKCQILLNQMEVTDKEIELEKRYRNLRTREESVVQKENNLKRQLEDLKNKKADLQIKIRNLEIEVNAEKQTLDPLKNLLKVLSYEFFKCINCQKISTQSVYFCVRQHCYCSGCLTNNCIKCNTLSEFNEVTNFDKILVKCDWPLCTTNIIFKDYISHTSTCQMRPYICPLQKCGKTLYTSDNLALHWHCKIPALINQNELMCLKHAKSEYYWLWKHDLYHVLMEFSGNGVDIIIEEVNVLPNNNKFLFQGYCSGYKKWDNSADFTNFCGKLKYSRMKSNSGYLYDKFKITVQN